MHIEGHLLQSNFQSSALAGKEVFPFSIFCYYRYSVVTACILHFFDTSPGDSSFLNVYLSHIYSCSGGPMHCTNQPTDHVGIVQQHCRNAVLNVQNMPQHGRYWRLIPNYIVHGLSRQDLNVFFLNFMHSDAHF